MQVANATHDRQHADKMLQEYVTTTITNVMSAFFGSQFSEQSTAVKVTVVIWRCVVVQPVYTAVRFLMRTFRNVFCVRIGKCYVRLWRSQRSRSFEEASGEMEVGRRLLASGRSHAYCRCWHWRRGHAPGTQTEPQLEAATSTGVILPETGQFMLLCSLQLWQQLQHCRQTRARVQIF